MKPILIQKITVMDPQNAWQKDCDVLIQDGKIAAVEKPGSIPETDRQIISGKGHWLLPGLIDMHVHLREPGFEHKETIESGSIAAVAGGFTTVACMANTSPVNDTPQVTSYIRERARLTAKCRVHPIGAVSKGLKGEVLAEIGGMAKEGIVALSDDGMPVVNSYLMRKAMDYARTFDLAVISHAEDPFLVSQGVVNEGVISNRLGLRGNPAAAEEIMVAREIALARLTGCRVHIAHLSTRLGLAHLRRAKEEGLSVTAEVSPHHLTLTEESVGTYDTHFKMAPPLRTQADVEALRAGLREGLIDCIASDHAPHSILDKATEFDFAACGILGLQTNCPVTFGLVQSGQLDLKSWIRAWTEGPARILRLPIPRVEPGQIADLVIFDPLAEWVLNEGNLFSKSKNSPFLGAKMKGQVIQTLVGGRVVYESG